MIYVEHFHFFFFFCRYIPIFAICMQFIVEFHFDNYIFDSCWTSFFPLKFYNPVMGISFVRRPEIWIRNMRTVHNVETSRFSTSLLRDMNWLENNLVKLRQNTEFINKRWKYNICIAFSGLDCVSNKSNGFDSLALSLSLFSIQLFVQIATFQLIVFFECIKHSFYIEISINIYHSKSIKCRSIEF